MDENSHFNVADENVVSVWAARRPFAELPKNYFKENINGEDDEPWNQFSNDFGFGHYDNDFVDTNFREDGRAVPIADLLEPVSYSASFRDAAIHKAREFGVGSTSYVILLYHFRYDAELTGVSESPYLRFVGTFDFDEDS